MQKAGLTKTIPLLGTTAIWGQYLVLFSSCVSSGYTLGGGCRFWLLNGGLLVSILNSLRAHHQGDSIVMAPWLTVTSFLYLYGRQHFFSLISSYSENSLEQISSYAFWLWYMPKYKMLNIWIYIKFFSIKTFSWLMKIILFVLSFYVSLFLPKQEFESFGRTFCSSVDFHV